VRATRLTIFAMLSAAFYALISKKKPQETAAPETAAVD